MFLFVLALLGICATIFIFSVHPSLAADTAADTQAAATFWERVNPLNLIPLAIGIIVQLLITLVGELLSAIISILIKYVIFYNDFIYTSIVMTGWEIVRDVANMFFVLILLFVAIATILSVESYNLKRFLPKIVFMAILINFSKVIAGAIIDFSQIVTWTFASVITGAGVENIYFSFGIQKFFTIANSGGNASPIKDWQLVIGLILGLILLIIAFVIILSYTIILVLRIVALWILIILSPLAYLLSAWPGGKLQGYSRQWWDEFSKYVIVAPVLMFFLWLALTASGADIQLNIPSDATSPAAGISDIAKPQNLIRFIVTAILLLVGLSAAQKSGVAGASFAGSAMSKMKRVAQGAVRKYSMYGNVADKAKAYMSARKSVRQEKIEKGAQRIARVVGGIKSLPAGTARLAGKGLMKIPGVSSAVAGVKKKAYAAYDQVGRFDKKTKEHVDKAEAAKLEAENFRNNAKKARNAPVVPVTVETERLKNLKTEKTSLQGELDAEQNKAVDPLAGYTEVQRKNNIDEITKKINKNEDDTRTETTTAEGEAKEKAEKAKEEEVKGFEDEAEKADKTHEDEAEKADKMRKKRDTRDKWARRALKLGGAGALGAGMVFSGGMGAALLAHAGAAAAFGPKVVKGLGKAGEEDKNLFEKHNAKIVNEKQDELKPLADHEVLEKYNDPKANKHEFAAAFIEALNRKLVPSLKHVDDGIARLNKEFPKNNRVLGKAESALERHYQAASRKFRSAGTTEEEINGLTGDDRVKKIKERDFAKTQVQDGFKDQSFQLKDFDKDSLKRTAEYWAPHIKTSSFVKQHEAIQDDTKKKDIEDILAKIASTKIDGPDGIRNDTKLTDAGKKEKEDRVKGAKEKLASITNVEKAYGKNPEGEELILRNEFIKKITVEQVRNYINKDNDVTKVVDSLRDALGGDISLLSGRLQKTINDKTSNGNRIAVALGIPVEETKKGKGKAGSDDDDEEEED